MAADDVVGVGVSLRKDVLLNEHEGAAVGLVLETLAALILDDLALVVELHFGEHISEGRDPVGLDP